MWFFNLFKEVRALRAEVDTLKEAVAEVHRQHGLILTAFEQIAPVMNDTSKNLMRHSSILDDHQRSFISIVKTLRVIQGLPPEDAPAEVKAEPRLLFRLVKNDPGGVPNP